MHDTVVNAIEIKELEFSYAKSGRPKVLQIDTWKVAKGQSVFLSGPSGTGKSTLLNLIGGTLPIHSPNRGEIRLLEQPFSSLSPSKRDKFRAKHIGMVFQQFNLIPYLSVEKNIEAAAYFGKTLSPDTKTIAKEYLQRMDLADTILSQRSDTLSVGQQQRVAVARALINKPEILIVDEPTSALDESAKMGFMNLLMQCVKELNVSLVFVSHDSRLASHFEYSLQLGQLNRAETSEL